MYPLKKLTFLCYKTHSHKKSFIKSEISSPLQGCVEMSCVTRVHTHYLNFKKIFNKRLSHFITNSKTVKSYMFLQNTIHHHSCCYPSCLFVVKFPSLPLPKTLLINDLFACKHRILNELPFHQLLQQQGLQQLK